MSSTGTKDDEVTAESVRTAEREATAAETVLADLEGRLSGGDLTVTADDLSAAEKLVKHAKLALEGVRTLWGRREAALRAKRLNEFADEIRAKAPKSGDDLGAALHAVHDAASEFARLAKAHSDQLREWRQTATTVFQIPEGGTEAGVGVPNAGGPISIDGVTLDVVDGDRIFSNVFIVNGGTYDAAPVRAADDDRLLATYALLDRIGEGL